MHLHYFQPAGYNHQFFMNQLNEILEDENVKGVVLKVNTPGGGVVESADIYDAISERFKKREKFRLCFDGWNGGFRRLLCISACR